MTIIKKEEVASGPIVAFTLVRRDGGKILHYHSGQYITLRVKKNNYFHNRHYTLCHPYNGKSYCIAIKQELEQPKGLVS